MRSPRTSLTTRVTGLAAPRTGTSGPGSRPRRGTSRLLRQPRGDEVGGAVAGALGPQQVVVALDGLEALVGRGEVVVDLLGVAREAPLIGRALDDEARRLDAGQVGR